MITVTRNTSAGSAAHSPDGRAWTEIDLGRPERRNSLDLPTVHALLETVAEVDATTTAALVIHSQGPDFCTGLDLAALQPSDLGPAGTFPSTWEALHAALDQCPVPVIAAVQGRAWNAGAALALAADFLVAQPATDLCTREVAQGLAAPVVATWLGIKHRGTAAATLLLTGATLTGADLVTHHLACALSDDTPLAAARRLASDLADLPALGVQRSTTALRAARPRFVDTYVTVTTALGVQHDGTDLPRRLDSPTPHGASA